MFQITKCVKIHFFNKKKKKKIHSGYFLNDVIQIFAIQHPPMIKVKRNKKNLKRFEVSFLQKPIDVVHYIQIYNKYMFIKKIKFFMYIHRT